MAGETQQRVKSLLAEGLCNKEIAERLHLSVRAVKWQIEQIMPKYGLYGHNDARRLIVRLVKEKLARLTNGAADSIVSPSTAVCSSNGRGENHHADDAAQL